MTLHLIQPRQLYGPAERQAELQQAWDINDAIFDEVTMPEGRCNFDVMFALCIPDMVNVIANSDIYFDHTLRDNIDKLDADELWALSRWDDHGDHLIPFHSRDSQDAWIIRGGPHDIVAPFTMGIPGCDNALAHIMHAAGWVVSNPCSTIHAIHLHRSGYRTYGEGRGKPKAYRIPPPYYLVPPT